MPCIGTGALDGASTSKSLRADNEAIKNFLTWSKNCAYTMHRTRDVRANALNGARCANTLNTSRSSQGRANAPNFIIIFSSGVNPGSSWVPQRVVRLQTGARYVSEGGRGVIPTAQAVGVIPRLYFIRPGRVARGPGPVALSALSC